MSLHLPQVRSLLPLFWYTGLLLLGGVVGCDPDDGIFTSSDEELAERIRRDTPIELPPITTVGANTMGAYVHTDTGRVLFVASGVDRPETPLAETLDCEAFQGNLLQSDSTLNIIGKWCRRSEIDDHRSMDLILSIKPDSVELFFGYSPSIHAESDRYWSRNFTAAGLDFATIRSDPEARIISGTFSGNLIKRSEPFDTISISEGRFDVTYGITP